jgi:hypothetical protein
MKKYGIFLFFILVCFDSFSQNKKIKIALVSHIDTTFTLINEKNIKKIDINLNYKWLKFFKTNLDSTKYNIQFESMPDNVLDNYFLKSYMYTDGFFKASPKLNKWFRDLNSKSDYDIIILLGRVILLNFTGLTDLNNYSYGLIQEKNWVFSLNRILTYKASNGLILHETKLNDYSDYIRRLKTADLSKIAIDKLDLNSIVPAVNVIDSINNCIGTKVCRKIESHFKSFQKK